MIADHFSPQVQIDEAFPAAQALDVTLRDGSFAVHFSWDEEHMRQIVQALTRAGLTWIELGYYGGVPELHNVKEAGVTADLPCSLIHDLAVEYPTASFALMIHPGSVQHSINFQELRQVGVKLVRFVYHPSWHQRLASYVRAAQEANLQVSINLALSSRYESESLLDLCEEIAQLSPDILYLADTCSAFYPQQVAELLTQIKQRVPVALGFHGHDFLSLAFANSLAATRAGAKYIDISLLGIGRGAGNLRAELWCASALVQQKGDFMLEELLEATTLVQQRTGRQPNDLASIICGVCNLTPPEEELLRSVAATLGDRDASLLACRYARQRASLLTLSREGLQRLLLQPLTTPLS